MNRSILLALLLSFTALAVEPTPAPSPAAVAGSPSEKISKKEVRQIRRSFTDILDLERDALRTEQTHRRKEGDANRKQRKKNWDNEEKISRRAFFAKAPHGPETREYMHKFTERRTAFYAQLKAEEVQEHNELDARWKALKESQRTRLLAIEEYLRRSERPIPRLLQRQD